MTPKYRPDIDGLRAIAVLAVLFFHAGFSVFSGGYVGVDIFFVISGYLITTIIVREIDRGDFSIANFYVRRFRRILPALVAVIVATLAVGIFLLAPNALLDLGESAITSALFSSNILFYFESGYFGGAAEMKPLLHTWSLAVEEQYYIFFPLLLMFIAKKDNKRYLRWLLILGVLSLVASVILTRSNPSAAFYWIPTRAWELFIGSILALQIIPQATQRSTREVNTLLGLAMILISIFVFTSETAFPGYAALLPTLGTALIIHAGCSGESVVAKLLSLRAMVFVGLISYSLYLWHWPIIVYTKIWSIHEPTHLVKFFMIASMFILAILSWKFVEAPFRKKVESKNRGSVLKASFAVSLAICLSGLLVIMQSGSTQSSPFDISALWKEKDPAWKHWRACEKRMAKDQDLCDIGDTSKPLSFLIMGDSHGRALASGLNLSAKNNGVKGKITTHSACPPLLSIDQPDEKECYEHNHRVMKMLAQSPEIETVVLVGRWPLFTSGERYKEESGVPFELKDHSEQSDGVTDNLQLVEIGLRRTLDKLQELDKKVVLINSVPEVGYDVPATFKIATSTGEDINELVAPTLEEYQARTQAINEIFKKLATTYSLDFISPHTNLCDAQRCIVVKDDIVLYRDDDHLSTVGSEFIAPVFDELFISIN